MPERPRLGLIVNPIAGMGGAVALKGTDDAVDEARERGAEPVAPDRARRFLDALDLEVAIVTCSGPMGEDVCQAAGLEARVLVTVDEPTSADDTRRAARAIADEGVDLLCFVGGDGTALDVADAIDHDVVCLGVPGGVKMNSAVFGETPEASALVVREHLAGELETQVAEVVEVDEDRLRQGQTRGDVAPRLDTLVAPSHRAVQAGKFNPGGSVDTVAEGALDLAEPGRVLVLGPGSTTHAIKTELVGEGTLLGVDVVSVDGDGQAHLGARDATARDLEGFDDALIVVSPIGGQGFVIGRGNQQLSPGLLDRVGWDNLRVVATRRKLSGLASLRADTGDPALDARAPRYVDVLTGPGFETRKKLSTSR